MKLEIVEVLLTVWDGFDPVDYKTIFLLISEHAHGYTIAGHVPDKGTGEPGSFAHTLVWAKLPISEMRAFQMRFQQNDKLLFPEVWTGIVRPVSKENER